MMRSEEAMAETPRDKALTRPPSMQVLMLVASAQRALEKAASLGEAKATRDKAKALRVYCRQVKSSLSIQNQCASLKLRAERKLGDMLDAASPPIGINAPPAGRAAAPAQWRSRAGTPGAPGRLGRPR